VGSLPTVPARHSGWDLEFAGTSHFVLPSHFIKTAVSFIATTVSFFNSLAGLFIGIPTILTITPIWITDPITTINIGTIQPRLCNRNPSDPPSTIARLSSSSTQAIPGPWIQGPILRTSIAGTVRPTQQGNKE
jgi:hypothetical protein